MSEEMARLALVIGNTRLHWALLSRNAVITHWNTDYLDRGAIASLVNQPNGLHPLLEFLLKRSPLPSDRSYCLSSSLLLASVVPDQTHLWQEHVETQLITLDHIPLQGTYSTMGIDRALAALGAVVCYNCPILVIDGGTALTFTGVDGDRKFIGGAILPGLQLQGRSLQEHTAALPTIEFSSESLITRWATNTPDSIRSGIFYTAIAGIRDFVKEWCDRFPGSGIVFTGGDGEFLWAQTKEYYSDLSIQSTFDNLLMFQGFQSALCSDYLHNLELR